ncbi:MAG: GIY-YIG nuclease family protein [Thaumarchaeota archaeon]|nr:GIY-YIG nuclease family protein [Nitrososphaerota archaeon]
MKREFTTRIKEHKESLVRLLNAAKITLKTMSNREQLAGVYILSRPDNGDVVYVGKSENIPERMSQHINGNGDSTLKNNLEHHPSYQQNASKYRIQYRRMANDKERLVFEDYVRSVIKPEFNR